MNTNIAEYRRLDSLTRNVQSDGNMFLSLWPRLVGDTSQSRVIVTKCRRKCHHVDGIDQIPKAMWFRVVSVNVTACNSFFFHIKKKLYYHYSKLNDEAR